MFRLPSLVALLCLIGSAWAQAPLPPGLPQAAGSQDTVRLEFPNADVGLVLDLYERLTGRRLVRENTVQGNVNILINKEIPQDEAIKIIEINLLMNGFSLIPAGNNIWKVAGTGKNPRNFGIPIYSEAEQLPDTEQIVTFVAKLQYQDPTEMAQVLGQAIPASPTLGQTITALPKAGALLITENTAVIRGILRIIQEVDLPPAEVISEFFPLRRADAKSVLEKLQDIIQPKSQSGATGAAPVNQPRAALLRPQVPNADGLPPNPQDATVESTAANTIEVNSGRVLSEDAVVVGKTILQADERTNRIHIVTRPINLRFFRRLIEQLDADTVFGEPVTRPLNFVQAGDIIDALRKSIADPGTKDDAGGSTTSRPNANNNGSSGDSQNFNDNNRFGNDSNGSGGGGTGGFSESLNTEERDVIPEAFTVGNTRIIADKRANTIIVIGNKDVQQKVFAFLDNIDVQAPQVMIHTVIGTLSLDNSENFGVDYVIRQSGSFNGSTTTTGTGTGGTTTTTGTPGSSIVNLGGLTAPGGLTVGNLINQDSVRQIAAVGAGGFSGFFTAGNALNVIVNALKSTGRFKVTASPNLFTSNNKKAVISSGTDIAVPTNIQTNLNGIGTNNLNSNSVNASVQFRTVALQLEVLPLINANGDVALEIVQKIDELTGVTDTIGGNPIPRIATRVLKTNVTVPNGATIVLGGLRREQDNISKRGIPFLSRIPGIGALFRSTIAQKTRDELVILLRPEVTSTTAAPVRLRERELEGFQLESDLETTLTPPGIRKTVPPVTTTFRRNATLREEEKIVVEPRGNFRR